MLCYQQKPGNRCSQPTIVEFKAKMKSYDAEYDGLNFNRQMKNTQFVYKHFVVYLTQMHIYMLNIKMQLITINL